jgi:hypothetical protein
MIAKDVKAFSGTCWYICSGLILNKAVNGWTYLVHKNDSWRQATAGNETMQSVVTTEDKNAFLSSVVTTDCIVSLQFKIYVKAKSLTWDDFVGGLLQSINGGYVSTSNNRSVKIIEEGRGVWKAQIRPPYTVYTQISPSFLNGQTIEHSFPAAYGVSGFSFIENAALEDITELSIKNAGISSNLPYRNLFCIKLGLKGIKAKALLEDYIFRAEDITKHALYELDEGIWFNRTLTNVPYTGRSVKCEKKVEWNHFLSILRSAPRKINLDNFNNIQKGFEME